MPARGTGAGRTSRAPQLSTRLAPDEYDRVTGYARTLSADAAELVRHALNAYEPRLRLAVKRERLR